MKELIELKNILTALKATAEKNYMKSLDAGDCVAASRIQDDMDEALVLVSKLENPSGLSVESAIDGRSSRLIAEEAQADPCTSYWLKEAIRLTFRRDPVDAVNDVEYLLRLLQKRLKEVQS